MACVSERALLLPLTLRNRECLTFACAGLKQLNSAPGEHGMSVSEKNAASGYRGLFWGAVISSLFWGTVVVVASE